MKNEKRGNKKWLVFFSIILLFIIPFMLARLFYAHKNWLPQQALNHGRLLSPPVTLQQISLDPNRTHHHWVLMLMHDQGCDHGCQENLYYMQQIQKALGKDADRMERVLAATQPMDNELQKWLTTSKTTFWLLDPVNLSQRIDHPERWYVVDPLGNIILSYSDNINPEDILDDIKHLMNISMIG